MKIFLLLFAFVLLLFVLAAALPPDKDICMMGKIIMACEHTPDELEFKVVDR